MHKKKLHFIFWYCKKILLIVKYIFTKLIFFIHGERRGILSQLLNFTWRCYQSSFIEIGLVVVREKMYKLTNCLYNFCNLATIKITKLHLNICILPFKKGRGSVFVFCAHGYLKPGFFSPEIFRVENLKLHLAYVLRWNRRKNIYFFSHI